MSDAVEALAREIVQVKAARNPAWATNVGLHEHDHRLPSGAHARFEEDLAMHDAWLARLDAAGAATSPGAPARLDADALRYALRLRRFELAELRTWERNPDFAMELLDALFALIVHPFAPLPQRLAAIASRLEEAPRFLAESRSRIRDPRSVPALWVAIAAESAAGAPGLLDAVLQMAREAGDAPLEARLAAAAEGARVALAEHAAWLDGLAREAAGSHVLGPERFDALLGHRLMGATARELYDLGHRLVEAHRRETWERARDVLTEAGAPIPQGNPVPAALAVVRTRHPGTFPEVLAAYERMIRDARAFTEARGLATLPPGERVKVVETPTYLRHLIPFAAYVSPPRFDPVQEGTYLVTPKEDLAAFHDADVRTTTVHEAYPGHHLQLSAANRHPSHTRVLVDAVETIEGWALYCETLMEAHGFTRDAGARFVRAKDTLWRAVRIVVDVGLATGWMTPEEAAGLLVQEVAMDPEDAEAEVKRYTLEPGYAMSYLLGRRGIERLRARFERRGWSERAFHDAILYAGSLPLPLLEAAVEARMPA